ncbi:EAL domain-containing protein [Cytobacillus gottheilii]|uniref:EAL domain-containing protein n=1 Tax=Cytobacillus gottheilii TaxID=859144 RepID=UPI001593BEC8|nr:EAL domain-containing protein [Cytobacillus gottheilii]
MEHFKNMLARELDKDKVSEKLEKIIFELIFYYINDMVFIMKVDEQFGFTYLFANEPASRHANLSNDYVGKTFEEIMPAQVAKTLQMNYEKVAVHKQTMIFTDEVNLADGSKLTGESILTPVMDEEGIVRYVVSVTRDITVSLMEKNQLIESEQRARSIVDHNLDGVITLDMSGRVVDMNPAGKTITGYSLEQFTSCSIADYIYEEDDCHFQQVFSKTKNGIASETLDCRFIHKNGEIVQVHLKLLPIVINQQVSGIYAIIRDLSQLTKNAEMIAKMSYHDQLTGLPNRRALLKGLDEHLETEKAKTSETALLYIDLDRFKYINDSFGHLVGDEILKKVAERLCQFEYRDYSVYRQGGDEFIILLTFTNREDANRFAQKILDSFKQSFYFDSSEYYITPSIGISLYPYDGQNVESLIKAADEALFRVKEKGKAHFQFYQGNMVKVHRNVVELETHLRKALENDELSLYYQPQVELASNEIISFEGLLRWHSKEFGFISPAEFIPLAEETGLILPIGQWVIDTACSQIKQWSERLNRQFRIAVNISPRQFQDHNLVDTIRLAIVKYDISPELLEVEITEGTMQDTDAAIPILNKLKKLGIMVSVDDFGTGYSSLSYLKQFPIDVLKIDQSFVRDVLTNDKDAAITTTIIHLAKSLGMDVIAEGVERKEQAQFLIEADCAYAQGYYYYRPLPAEEIENIMMLKE